MRLDIEVRPPFELDGFRGSFETTGAVRIRRSFHTVGTDSERFVFRRHFEQIGAILNSLQEINCVGSVTCAIRNGQFQISGQVRLWFNGAESVVTQALRHLNDHGWQAARSSPRSHADIHALITKFVQKKHAA